MKKLPYVFMFCLVFANLCCAYLTGDNDKKHKAWKELASNIPTMYSLIDEHPDDLDLQLGLTVFLNRFGCPCIEQQYERVFKIDPNNKISWAIISEQVHSKYCARISSILNPWENYIQQAKHNKTKEIKILSGSNLYSFFKEGDPGVKMVVSKKPIDRRRYYLLITDWDFAEKRLLEDFVKEEPNIVAFLNKGESVDIDNSYYNYMKASLYFKLKQMEDGIKEIEIAVKKGEYNFYREEREKAKERVLDEIPFPEEYKYLIMEKDVDITLLSRTLDFMTGIAKEYEDKGDLQKADKICYLIIKISKQIQLQPQPFVNKWGQGIEKRALKEIAEIRKKTEKSK